MDSIRKILGVIKLFRRAFARQFRKLLLMTLLGFVGGTLGGIGVGAVIPLFYIVTRKSAQSSDTISRTISKFFTFFHIPQTLPSIIGLIIVLFICKAIFMYVANYINAGISVEMELETQKRLFSKTLHTTWPYLMHQKAGYLSAVLMGDVGGVASVLNSVSSAILVATSLITYTIIAFNISAYITLLTITLGALLSVVMKPVFYKVRTLSGESSGITKEISHFMNQNITGAKTIKAMSLEEDVIAKCVNFFVQFKEMRLKQLKYSVVFSTFLEPISIFFVVIIFLTSYRNPAFDIATFVAIIYLVQKMFSFVQSIQGKLNNLNETLPLINIVVGYEKELDKNHEPADGGKKFNFQEKIEFKDIFFDYGAGSAKIENINFEIRRGEMVGLIGPSGAGKTTVVDLILRLLKPVTGEIKIDGHNIEEIGMKSWHKNIGYVSQDIFLTNDTVENNIRFYNQDLSHEEIMEAARLANILDLIDSLPEKFDTIVGERGVRLSGGERQRIVLARVIARKPQILVLDEATSALDNESEHKIQESIKSLRGKITIFIIAHRLSTVVHSDKIIVLNDGTIIESGSPEELLNNTESYFHKNYNIDKNK